TGSYTDIDTGITFHGYVPQSAYRFGMVLPQEPTTDFIAQLVSPLSDKGGWGGIGFASSMIGTLLLATWPNGTNVITAPLIAKSYAGVVPYTANPITLSPIKRGTYVNSTHITSTFLCGGCINDHSFSPAQSKDSKSGVYLVYAYSQAAVTDPAGIKATLPDHTSQPGGGWGIITMVLSDARSEHYDTYAAQA
ncbi:uncharacterized protein THITE_2027819, partial [Thermothielavioides terrestris NRRL 8126]